MSSIPHQTHDDDGGLREVVATSAGVIRATLIGACAWLLLLGAWSML